MCYYALLKLHFLPHEILDLPQAEQAFIYAAISEKVKADKVAMQKAKRKH